MTVTALIVAAGKGERLGGDLPKQYRSIGGKPVLRWAVEAMARHPSIDRVRVVIGPGQDDLAKVRGLSSGWKSNDIGARLMAAVAEAKPLEGDEIPKREPTRPGLTKDAALVSDLLKLLLKIRAK